ncbi:hypothetical protein [Sutcliffiella horikoshii]|uniref:hypothetical protein n=1 Tax=Sutcliffiella horikoshii TaxID=79883 RepID=UPI001F1A1895|nr:hypothetical protein [Sutcliffiella horikoshii]MCG1023292.1 hypothetical protein [Sutcliffiella horikoshii]
MKNYEKRHYFMVAAMALVIFSPLIIWLLPYMIHKVLHDGSTVWIVETPLMTYIYFAVALLVLITGAVLSFFYYRLKVAVSLICFFVAISTMFIGIKPVTVVDFGGMATVAGVFSDEQRYGWEDIEKVYLVINDETKEQSLEIHFKDKEIKTFDRRDEVQNLRIQMLELSRTYGFEFTSKE